MTDQNGAPKVSDENANPSDAPPVSSKGKGKAVEPVQTQDMSMDEDEESSEEEHEDGHEEPEEEDADNMEEISTENIINDGRRTRGKTIDFAKAAQDAGEDLDDDSDDDEDFEEEDAMEE